MACASQALISANTCAFPSSRFLKKLHKGKGKDVLFTIRASSASNTEESDCNAEECAPDKEVGKVSMEWVAVEKTKVVGTYPPRKKGWTGYVEKDTAGQTNIYSVEPVVYVAESGISSGTAGTSSEGSENTAAIAAGLALIFVAAASSILIQVGKNPPQMQTSEYSGPSLSYFVNKFKSAEIIQASIPAQPENSPAVVESSAPEVPQVDVESNGQPESPTLDVSNVS
ncbi:protein MAINTENANCE OF PSII UNDER HIGH LIGHT 1 [Telopea speciosissima]|uniref:protein MAINTENANCE OF PSII UNDER HIGH LIGHT 1 n=1 Tax=Telopea speciosissima TaxID=54955 RepID=UPI001CC75E3A|nr:protein MAINTENANCE OF PSII UNDER HIGH LIGHT 1 [Telopea speciosissima]